MAQAKFTIRGVEYTVCGHVSADNADKGGDGIIVARVDGEPIPGARMMPGMVQIGLPANIERSAIAAIKRAQRKSKNKRMSATLVGGSKP